MNRWKCPFDVLRGQRDVFNSPKLKQINKSSKLSLGNYLSSNSERVAGHKKYMARNLEVSDLKGEDEDSESSKLNKE